MVLKKAKSLAAFAAMLISGVSTSHAMLDKESENIKAYGALLSTRAKKISSLRMIEKNLQYFTEDSKNNLDGRLNELFKEEAERKESMQKLFENSQIIEKNITRLSEKKQIIQEEYKTQYEVFKEQALSYSRISYRIFVNEVEREYCLSTIKRNELNSLKLDLKSTNKRIHILEKEVPNIKLLHDQYKELEKIQSFRSHTAKVIAEKRSAWFENFNKRRILEARKTRSLQAQQTTAPAQRILTKGSGVSMQQSAAKRRLALRASISAPASERSRRTLHESNHSSSASSQSDAQ